MYTHLTLVEREKLAVLLAKGLSQRHIAKAFKRSQSSLSRELKRNIRYGNEYFGNTYLPCKAQVLADKRTIRQRTKAPLKGPQIFLYVREHLRDPYCWTPEQIAGRLPLDHPGESISTETIYRYIYSKQTKRHKLWKLLPLVRKKRMKKLGRRVQRDGKLIGVISIDKRPLQVNQRKKAGHWETDNIIGKASDATAISTTVERLTRFTLVGKVTDRTAAAKTRTVTHRLRKYPRLLRQSITIDNGKENASLPIAFSIPIYACHAYHSWEKGTNENTNGRIRRFIPKGFSLDKITKADCVRVEHWLNHTPRKCLGFLTPYEKMEQLVKTK